jgi:hypothetical protein
VKKFIAILFLSLSASTLAKAGGSIGGGSGLTLELLSNQISQEIFQRMIIVGQEGDPLIINGYAATVEAVDMAQEFVEVKFTDGDLKVTLESID